ncbi:hypothetical protein LTR10_024128 [Elasticomyces elasticus]|uniref:DUF1479 domain protein n=1 Tax=Exophiala sideris TaxID=1016849 RepID=A0ABR0JKT7_9EURO|nr:hypothetical protein LTR10_024128 [Elasticomyces elasticus]KAK5032228.1 hypothetical protein LTR13_007445 [Exophiala sideris]KAK5036226.1 hypothetical protein LTS07_001951 [Exophiala sideris]KAK5066609.1 hypothetical protein LTR69_001955 [Exophiala sideris]KAK5180431.1 hypothetical protein LTR44_007188 [Eurotiomycetes sp. CCFEE 6388]
MKNQFLSSCRRAVSTLTKEAGDISSVFPSLSGKKPDPLPPRFADLKKSLIKGNEEALTASWQRLLSSLKREIDEIRSEGSNVVPSIDYKDVAAGTVSQTKLDALRHRGTAVIRNVVPKQEATALKQQAQEYIAANPSRVKAFPPDNPAVYELYWTPSQVQARAHPNLLKAQSFLASLWHSSDPSSEISTTYPLTYADRFRIRRPGDAKFALGPHTDGGSVERWEDPEYSRVYQAILRGQWEEYDPFDARHRIDAKMDMYNGAGACSMFRLFQGWLSMSSTGPGEGTLKVCPLVRHATAYLILRPFFDAQTGKLNLDATFPNSVPGACQEYNTETHPDLDLETTMVSMPQVEPGDYVAWHCDMIHAVDKEHRGKGDSSVLYIPACAMTKSNIEFLNRQRISALRYSPPPDFPGAGGNGEVGFTDAVNWNDVGKEGKRAMGLGNWTWDVTPNMTEGERKIVEEGNNALFG